MDVSKIGAALGGKITLGEMKETGSAKLSALDPSVFRTLPPFMTLDELMTWLGAKMKDTDSEIRTKMSEMSASKSAQNKLDEIISALNAAKTKVNSDGSLDATAVANALDDLKSSGLYDTLSPEVRASVDALVGAVVTAGYRTIGDLTIGGTTYKSGYVFSKAEFEELGLDEMALPGIESLPMRMTKENAESMIQSLTNTVSGMSSGNEIAMIELQSKISARAQTIQLISNMIASFHDTATNIIGNTRS